MTIDVRPRTKNKSLESANLIALARTIKAQSTP